MQAKNRRRKMVLISSRHRHEIKCGGAQDIGNYFKYVSTLKCQTVWDSYGEFIPWFGKPNRHAIKFTGALLQQSRIARRVKCNSSIIQCLVILHFCKEGD